MDEILGERIKDVRKRKGMTQEVFAREIGISRSYLGDLENNRKSLNLVTLRKIAAQMNVSVSYLIGEDN